MEYDPVDRELTLKVVYYGPPLSGKTTNLRCLHQLLGGDEGPAGDLTILDTSDDRTLFFDLLPVVLESNGVRVRLRIFTVPGQVVHAATRRLVLQGADGIVFVADSQRSEARRNNQFWLGMETYLQESGTDPDSVPKVVQFNKRDLDDVRSDEELDVMATKSSNPIYKAVAIHGEGVLESLQGLIPRIVERFENEYETSDALGPVIAAMKDALGGLFEPSSARKTQPSLKAHG